MKFKLSACLFLVAFFALPNTLLAQFYKTFKLSQTGAIEYYKNQIKWSPFRMIDLVNAGTEISYERRFSDRTSSQLSLTAMAFPLNTTSYFNVSGARVSFEQKYFIHLDRNQKKKAYVSAEFVYLHKKFDDYYDITEHQPNDTSFQNLITYRDTFTQTKQTLTLNFKIGRQEFIIGKHIVADICVGLGLKYVKLMSTYPENTNPNITVNYDHHYFLIQVPYEHTKYLTINIPMNLKIGYAF